MSTSPLRRSTVVVTVLVAAAAVALAACGRTGEPASSAPTAADGVRVASFDFPESVLLAELFAQVVESTGTPVVRVGAVGPREIAAPALELGLIDLVPEYLGASLAHLEAIDGATSAGAAPESPRDPGAVLVELNELLAPRGLVALEPAPAQDTNVFVVSERLSRRNGVTAISDLAPLAGAMTVGGPPECVDRPLCLAGLEEVYGLRFADFVAQPTLEFTAEALRRGEIDLGVMFSTDAALVARDLVVLDDDRGLQPAENVVAVVRSDALERWGDDVADALAEVSAALTTDDLRLLNLGVGEHRPVAEVAASWLGDHGIRVD